MKIVNKSNSVQLVRIFWEKKEVKPWEIFECLESEGTRYIKGYKEIFGPVYSQNATDSTDNPEKKEVTKMNKTEISNLLKSMWIEFDESSTKNDLIKLYEDFNKQK